VFDVDPDTPEKGHTHPTQFGAVVDIFPLFCRRFDIRRFRLSPFWSVAVLTIDRQTVAHFESSSN